MSSCNQELEKIYLEKGITRCEICGSTHILSFHHRKKRRWYKLCPELLVSFNQTILVCAEDHDKLDNGFWEGDKRITAKEFSKEQFKRLRGDEDIVIK